jgi:hypothetical protein
MSSNGKPLITIVGALSKQGRSAAHTLLQSGRYRVRALTRRVDAPEAQNLARRGAELMTGPLEAGHKGDLVNAFRGSQGVFLMMPPIGPLLRLACNTSLSALLDMIILLKYRVVLAALPTPRCRQTGATLPIFAFWLKCQPPRPICEIVKLFGYHPFHG